MEKLFDIVALGELLIDFTETGKSRQGMKLFEQNPGGAPANLLTAASHMGCSTAFIGKVGADMQGTFLKETLKKEGIDVRAVIKEQQAFTTLAFVELDENGERTFSFARKPGADSSLRKEELDKELLSSCKIFHFGSLSLTEEPAKGATIEAVKIAKTAGVIISYDPNYRKALWNGESTAVEMMRAMIPFADLMKVSEEESYLLTGIKNSEQAADKLLGMGVQLVAVTLGKDGVLIATKERKETIKGFDVNVVDTTGAGDSFWGGFLSQFVTSACSIGQWDWEEIKRCAVIGNATAGLCVQKRGGIPAIPKKEEVSSFLAKQHDSLDSLF